MIIDPEFLMIDRYLSLLSLIMNQLIITVTVKVHLLYIDDFGAFANSVIPNPPKMRIACLIFFNIKTIGSNPDVMKIDRKYLIEHKFDLNSLIPLPKPEIKILNTKFIMSLAKQNFASVTEAAINGQINTELQASQEYTSLAGWAGNSNVALPGLAKFFNESASEEREHANKLINYQNLRGGKVVLTELKAPTANWSSAKEALEAVLQLEKDVNKSLLNLHKIAGEQNDPQLCDYIESTFLSEQVEAIKKIADYVTQLNRTGGDGLGLYLFDQDLLAGKSINVDHAI
ncbi:hypothetical protein G9A89_007173 [Geosiphon pyriformis]|nr:hypothetical protein G9A89_007173 [Geosiphon pyriformis]